MPPTHPLLLRKLASPVPTCSPLLEEVAHSGVALQTWAREAQIAPGCCILCPIRCPQQTMCALLDAGARLSGHTHFGLRVGQRVRPGTYSVMA